MANLDIIMPARSTEALPVVRKIHPADLKDVLARGLEDFWAMPTHVVFLSLIYPLVGILLAQASFDNDFIPLLYPMAAGFALLGPLAAIWLYELSRRRELGMDTSWRHAFDVLHSPSLPAIAGVAFLLLAIFVIWIACAQAIYQANFGALKITTANEFVRLVLGTPQGHNLIIAGNLVGFLFAMLAAALSVISFPLLLDRNVGFSTAVLTSLKAVARNPIPMAIWGLIVAAALALGSIPCFIGLAVVMPILGHATWHLYRKLVEPDSGPRPEYQSRQKGTRYAADFPASIFARTVERRGTEDL
jgi:uncharacterized membrane protein